MLIVSLGSFVVPGDMLIIADCCRKLQQFVLQSSFLYRTSVWSTTSARKLWTLNSMLMRQLSTSHWSWQDSTSTMKMLLGTNWSLILETCPSHNLQSQLFLRVTSHQLTSYLTYILTFYLTIFIRRIFFSLTILIFSFWHFICHSIWHIFGHFTWHSIRHSIWHLFWHRVRVRAQRPCTLAIKIQVEAPFESAGVKSQI